MVKNMTALKVYQFCPYFVSSDQKWDVIDFVTKDVLALVYLQGRERELRA